MSLLPRKSQWIPAVFILACFFFCAPHLFANRQRIKNLAEGPNTFFVDSANFFDPETGTSRLEVYYKVANDHLQFIKEKDGYRASFQILCVVYDQKGHQVTGDIVSDTQWVRTYDETNSRREFAHGQLVFFLPSGEYGLRVWVEDRYCNEMVRMERQALVFSFDGPSLVLSDLLLASEICSTETRTGAQVRNGLLLVPNVDRGYSDLRPLVTFYFEIYDLAFNGSASSFFEVEWEVVDLDGEIALADSGKVLRRGDLSFDHRVLDITSLPEGKYILRLRVRDPQAGRTAQRETPFTLHWSNLGQVAKDFKEAVEQLRYIATEQEYRKLKDAQENEWKEVWLKFWADRDPTPGTPQNEMQNEFYRRIEYTNAHFSVISPGWKSDRGRIYIVHGPPDEIERHPMDIGLKPYEIWYYYSSNHFFYFLDENGYGEYKLVNWQ